MCTLAEIPVVEAQPNPTSSERYQLLQQALTEGGHPEDFWNIVNLLNPPTQITKISVPPLCKGKRIAVVGAGLAGLSAAFELRKLGFDITIFEKQRERIGGRVYTYYFDEGQNLYGELGASAVPIAHQTVWHYIDLFHLRTRPCFSAVRGDIYDRGIRVRNDPLGLGVKTWIYPQYQLTACEKNLPWENWLDVYIRHDLLRILPEERREILQIKRQYCDTIRQYYGMTVRQILEKNRMSNGGTELLSVLSLRNAALNDCSYDWSRKYIEADACMYQIEGGSSKLADAFYQSLLSQTPPEYRKLGIDVVGSVRFQQGVSVTQIDGSKPKTVRLICRQEGTEETTEEEFDCVICTVPFCALRGVKLNPAFSPEKMQAIRELRYMTAQRTLFLCSKPFWKERGIFGGRSVTDLPIQEIVFPAYPAYAENVQLNTAVLTAASSLGQDAVTLGSIESSQRLELIKRQVEATCGLSDKELDDIVLQSKTLLWSDAAGFYGAFACYSPGQKVSLSAAAAQPEYDGRVLFAGADISTQPGWMQGALQSGMLAAHEAAYQTLLHPFTEV